MHKALHKPGIKTVLVSKNLIQYFETLSLISTNTFFICFFLICNIAELIPDKPF